MYKKELFLIFISSTHLAKWRSNAGWKPGQKNIVCRDAPWRVTGSVNHGLVCVHVSHDSFCHCCYYKGHHRDHSGAADLTRLYRFRLLDRAFRSRFTVAAHCTTMHDTNSKMANAHTKTQISFCRFLRGFVIGRRSWRCVRFLTSHAFAIPATANAAARLPWPRPVVFFGVFRPFEHNTIQCAHHHHGRPPLIAAAHSLFMRLWRPSLTRHRCRRRRRRRWRPWPCSSWPWPPPTAANLRSAALDLGLFLSADAHDSRWPTKRTADWSTDRPTVSRERRKTSSHFVGVTPLSDHRRHARSLLLSVHSTDRGFVVSYPGGSCPLPSTSTWKKNSFCCLRLASARKTLVALKIMKKDWFGFCCYSCFLFMSAIIPLLLVVFVLLPPNATDFPGSALVP